MTTSKTASNVAAPTQFLQAGEHGYAYRRFGEGSAWPLLFLQHFTGTLDNWDPAITDPLAPTPHVTSPQAREALEDALAELEAMKARLDGLLRS